MGNSANVNVAAPVVMITGASGGLGVALTRHFAGAGWRVAAAARKPIAERENITPVVLDVTDVTAINGAFEEVMQRFGRLNVLINNAGVTEDTLCSAMDEAQWDRVLNVNLRGTFLCCRAASRIMLRQRDGHIINISSFSARSGPRGQCNYAAAKAGVVGLTQSLARELGGRNVRANVIFPGVMPTSMTAKLSEQQMKVFAEANTLGRINSVEEVARFIVFLAGTRNISGQVFQLDSRIAPWT